MGRNLFDTVWDLHKVTTLEDGQDQLLIGLHLIHEVTSPQAFHMLREKGLPVRYPRRTVATVDHIVPTDDRARPFQDELAEKMIAELERNTSEHGIEYFGPGSEHQGIVHIIGPELGLTQPGMTIACGDSHTSTHGAFGAIAFGIGTSQVRDVLATGTVALNRPKVRRVNFVGTPGPGATAKDLALKLMAELGVKGGIGHAYEYGGEAIERLSMEERMTLCNMSIEGGARMGYVNPDQTTFDYLRGRPRVPAGAEFDRAVQWWRSIASGPDAEYDDVVTIDVEGLQPMVTWGINPGQAVRITDILPALEGLAPGDRDVAERAYDHMGLTPGAQIIGTKINVAFIGSCTNGRISDLRSAAAVLRGRHKAEHVRAFVVPGSAQVAKQAREEGLVDVFQAAGFEFRAAGCSMCLAMNQDKLNGDEVSASSSNRNFIGRQGSARGRTILMSPAMVAAAAVAGHVVDYRDLPAVQESA